MLSDQVDSSNESSNIDSQKSSASELLTQCWQSLDKVHQIGVMDRKTNRFQNIPVKGVAEAVNKALELSSEGFDTYFAVAEYLTPGNRKADNASGAWGFWMDIDCGEEKAKVGKGYLTEEEAIKATKAFCKETELPEPTFIIYSGSGLHLYWLFDTIIGSEEWKSNARMLKALTHAAGFMADDSRTSDIASVLRIPGTLNHKYNPPKPVVLKHAAGKLMKQELMLNAINKAYSKLCARPENTRTEPKSELTTTNADPELAKLKSALMQLDPDCDEETWKLKRLAPLALLAREYPDYATEIRQIAIDWSSGELCGKPAEAWSTISHNSGLTGKMAFEQEWARFNHAGNNTKVATIYYDAKKVGWSYEQDRLAVIQESFCLINFNGTPCILDRHQFNKQSSAARLVVSKVNDGRLFVGRKVKALFPTEDVKSLVNEFLVNPNTICYQGIEFNPVGTSEGYFNLWVGPTLQPKVGDWTLIQSFLLNVICDGDEKSYQYLIRYIAHAIQKPEEKPGVMLILLGGQGTGKGTLGRIFQEIWSATYLQVCSVDSITGNFNAALECSYIVFMDEALFAGDRRASDALKSLVTEPLIHINEKYQPARQMRSYHRFIAATNADHFKNTESDDRRDFVLRVSETRKNDHGYWQELNHEIDHGGGAAMMHELLAMDLSDFNVRDKPQTEALLEQKIMSLGHIERWWFDCLERGYFQAGDCPNLEGEESGEWGDFIGTNDAIEGIKEVSGGKIYKIPIASDVKRTLLKLCPSAIDKQKAVGGGRKKRGLTLPSLKQARSEFDQYMGGEIDWPKDDE